MSKTDKPKKDTACPKCGCTIKHECVQMPKRWSEHSKWIKRPSERE